MRTIEDFNFRLTGSDDLDLPHKNIRQESEKIKGREKSSPEFQQVVLADDPVSLNHTEIIPQSVAVASDQSLGTVYRENVDFHVDHKNGLIKRLPDGSIFSGSNIAVWYYHYRIYTRNTDYAMFYSAGKIKRLPEGAIEDGQAVWIDYEIEAGSFSDDMLSQALEEANAIIRGQIREEYLSSDDSRLTVAETYLTLSVLARMKALEMLQSQYIDAHDRSGMADEYMRLGKTYSEQADSILYDFRKAFGSISFPTRIRN